MRLRPGDVVVIDGQDKLQDGAKVVTSTSPTGDVAPANAQSGTQPGPQSGSKSGGKKKGPSQ